MRTIQQTFDAVIAAGNYDRVYVGCFSSEYMCNALANGVNRGTITDKEHDRAMAAIKKYMAKYFGIGTGYCLSHGLVIKGVPFTFDARLKIYQNWAKRPRKFKKV
jgi:hypothetical protein